MTPHPILLLLGVALTAGCQSAGLEPAGTVGGSSSDATMELKQTEGHWLIGAWDGPAGRVIDVWSVRPDGTAQGTMGIVGQGQGRAAIRVEGSRVHVVNAIKNAFDLTLVSDGRMTGTVTLAVDGTVHPWAVTKRNGRPCTKPITVDVRSYGPPLYCALDTWIFSTGRVQTIVRVEEDRVVMAGPDMPGLCPGCVVNFDRNLTLRSIERTDGQPLGMPSGWRMIGDGWRFWDFPLSLKKSWRISSIGISNSWISSFTVDCTVTAYEEVTTKAGTFKAFKVLRNWRFKNSDDGGDRGNKWSDTVWFAPEVKTVIKRMTFNTVNPADRDWELVSYGLK